MLTRQHTSEKTAESEMQQAVRLTASVVVSALTAETLYLGARSGGSLGRFRLVAERAFVFREFRLAHEALFPLHDLVESGEAMEVGKRVV